VLLPQAALEKFRRLEAAAAFSLAQHVDQNKALLFLSHKVNEKSMRRPGLTVTGLFVGALTAAGAGGPKLSSEGVEIHPKLMSV
jgi:hypothetical protein